MKTNLDKLREEIEGNIKRFELEAGVNLSTTQQKHARHRYVVHSHSMRIFQRTKEAIKKDIETTDFRRYSKVEVIEKIKQLLDNGRHKVVLDNAEVKCGVPSGNTGGGATPPADTDDKPYPAGHLYEGLTPKQVSEGYKRYEESEGSCADNG